MLKLNSILLIVTCLIFVSACQDAPKTLPILGNKEEVDGKMIYHEIPDFSFVNQDSQTVDNATFAERAYVSTEFFINCPSICPKITKSMLRIHNKFKQESNLLLLSHTIDTKYDTIPRLKKYAENLDVTSDKWHFVTGDKQEIFDIQEKYFNVAIEDSDAPGGYNHSGRIVLVDKNRRIRAQCDGTDPKSVDKFLVNIGYLMDEMAKGTVE